MRIHVYNRTIGGAIERKTRDAQDDGGWLGVTGDSIPLTGWPTPAMRQAVDSAGNTLAWFIGVDADGGIVDVDFYQLWDGFNDDDIRAFLRRIPKDRLIAIIRQIQQETERRTNTAIEDLRASQTPENEWQNTLRHLERAASICLEDEFKDYGPSMGEPVFDDGDGAQADQTQAKEIGGRVESIEAVNIQEVWEWAPWAFIVVEVEGGYQAFERASDYERWLNPTFALPKKMKHKNLIGVTALRFLASKRV